MVERLNRLRKFGVIHPPYLPPNCDRVAFFSQDNRYFDSHQRLIEPGVTLDPDDTDEEVEAEDTGPPLNGAYPEVPLGTLLALAPKMPLEKLRAAAERLLGEGRVHKSRQQITTQLRGLKKTNKFLDFEDFQRQGTRTTLAHVTKFIKTRYGKVVTSRAQALAVLRQEGLIGEPPKQSATVASGPSLVEDGE